MKTKLTRISKRTLALLLCLLMLFSTLYVSIITAYAYEAHFSFMSDSTSWSSRMAINKSYNNQDSKYYLEVYMKNGEHFALHNGSDQYGPASNNTSLGSTGQKGTYSTNAWKFSGTTGWNRVCVDEYGSDKEWYPYVWVESVPIYVAGETGLCKGDTEWQPNYDGNEMTNSNGVYSITYTGVSAKSAGYQFKICNGSWDYSWNSVTASSGTWGSLSTSGDNALLKLNYNSNVTISFNSSTKNISVKVTPIHTAKVGTITGSGSVKVNSLSSTTVAEGTYYNIEATPNSGYKLTALAVNGTSIIGNHSGATSKVTVSHQMETSNETVTATFTAITYTVSYTLGQHVTLDSVTGGTDNEDRTITATHGSTVVLNVTYDVGYEFDSGTSSLGGATPSNSNKTFTFSSIKADKKITINAKQSAQSKLVKYYVDLHSNTPTTNPTIKFGSGSPVTLTREGDSTVYSADVPTPYSPDTKQVVNPATITFNGQSYDVSIGDKDINDIKEVWIESRGTLDGTTTDNKFKVMSYASYESTFTVNGGTFSGISTKLYGTEGSGDLDNVINGCGIITKNSDSSYTVKYAKEDNDTQYGALSLHVSFTSTPDKDCYFDGWYIGEDKSDNYKSADAEIWLDGKNYELSYVEKTTWNVTVLYKYDLYDDSEKMYYDADYAETHDKTYTYTFSGITFTGDIGDSEIPENNLKEYVEHNAPTLVNDYYEYSLISDPESKDPENGYKVDYNNGDKTCTITANLKKTVRMYTVTLNGEQHGEKQSYQALVKIQSGEVLGFNDNQNLIWSDDGKDVATGTSYSFRVTGDMHITARENTTGETFNGKSIIAHRSFDVNTALKELVHNFYIADFYNDSVGGRDSYVQFYGGGVLYFAMDKTTGKGKPTKATGAVDETGEAIKGEIEKVVERVAGADDEYPYLDDKLNITDTDTNIVCRYLNFEDHENLFKYSDELQAYQYIYSPSFLNDDQYKNYSLRVYSYFVYYDINTDKYTISVSDDHADAKLYEVGK